MRVAKNTTYGSCSPPFHTMAMHRHVTRCPKCPVPEANPLSSLKPFLISVHTGCWWQTKGEAFMDALSFHLILIWAMDIVCIFWVISFSFLFFRGRVCRHWHACKVQAGRFGDRWVSVYMMQSFWLPVKQHGHEVRCN